MQIGQNGRRLGAVLLAFGLVSGMMPTGQVSAAKKAKLAKKTLTLTVGQTKKISVKNKKKGKSSCGCSCADCPVSGSCHTKK